MIPSEVVEEVRRLVDPVVLIGNRVKLWKCGAAYAGLCPFHEEKQGSFRLYPKEKRFICFGCGASGDIFAFFQRADGKPFPVVLRELATSVGIVIPRERPRTPEEERGRAERAALLAACEAATSHWQQNLWGPRGKEARDYLARRGVREEVVRAFRLGYAVDEWHDVERALRAARIPLGVQHDAGVLTEQALPEKATRYYDRFRHRIVFPVEDGAGRVIGFAGRAIGIDAGLKYVNGPETRLYKKARSLYGLHQAREAIRRTGKAILVEGYFDALALHQVGFQEAVAAGGTAISSEQIGLLAANGCRELVLFFDGDEGGANAPARAARALLQAKLAVTVVRLSATPDGESDPDALVARGGKEAVDEALASARPLTEVLIDDALGEEAEGAGAHVPVEYKLRAIRTLTPLVLAAPEGLARSTFERAVARRLDIDIGPMRQEFQRIGRATQEGGRPCASF